MIPPNREILYKSLPLNVGHKNDHKRHIHEWPMDHHNPGPPPQKKKKLISMCYVYIVDDYMSALNIKIRGKIQWKPHCENIENHLITRL
jgi:hypothetical protein